MATVHWTREDGTPESLADRVLQFGAMTGAAAGAFAGVGLTGVLAGGTDLAPILGTAGTVLGSVVCALAGRYLLLPVWVATRRVSARAQDAGTPKH